MNQANSDKFTRTKKHEPCPICADTKGKCGFNGELIFCMDYPDGGGEGRGYKFLKTTQNLLWGIYAVDDGVTFDKAEWKSRRRQEELAKQEALSRTLSPLERHFEIKRLLNQLELTSAHRQKLLERGFTAEQIDQIGYRSISARQKLTHEVSNKLAGIASDGKSLTHNSAGILVPVPNNLGQVIGYQIRNDEGTPKYVWAWGEYSVHLPNGEVPIGFFGADTHATTIGFAEGFTKSPVAAARTGISVVGAAGGNFVSSPQQLKSYLLDYSEGIIYPDAGSVNNYNIVNNYRKLVDFCTERGLSVKLAWYGQFNKPRNITEKLTGGDIDEIDQDTFDSIEYISWEQFESFCSPDVVRRLRGSNKVVSINKEERWDNSGKEKRREELTKFDAAIKINARYFPDNLPIPKEANFIAIKAPKGTGKTTFLSKIVKSDKVLIITHRVCLEQVLADTFRLDSRHNITQEGKYLGHALCINSLHSHANPRFDYSQWTGADIVIDEFDQLFYHLVASSTCDTYKPEILDTWIKVMRHAVTTGGKIYISSADLASIHIAFLKSCIGIPVEYLSIENTYVPFAGERHAHIYENKWQILQQCDARLKARKRILLFTTSVNYKSQLSTKNLETRYQQLGYKVLRADAESVSTPNHPAAEIFSSASDDRAECPLWSKSLQIALSMAKLSRDSMGKKAYFPYDLLRYSFMVKRKRWDDALRDYNVVIASPVLETGISIVGVFDEVFYLSESGVQTVNSVGQSIARERANVPRHIYVPKTSRSRLMGGVTHWQSLVSDQNEEANKRLLSTSNYALMGARFTDQCFLRLYCQMTALHNIGFLSYRESVIMNLQESGYVIDRVQAAGDHEEIQEQVAAIKEQQHNNYCEAVATAFPLTTDEAKKIAAKRRRTDEERVRLHGYEIRERYLESEITPELVNQDIDGLFKKAMTHYYLTVGSKFIEMRDIRAAEDVLKYSRGTVFQGDVIKSAIAPKIALLKEIGIEQFLDADQEFTKQSLEGWFLSVIQRQKDLRRVLGINLSGQTVIAFVNQQLLPKLGLKLEQVGWRKIDGKRTRVYKGAKIPDNRLQYFDRWRERDENALQEFQLKRADWETYCSVAGDLLKWMDADPEILQMGIDYLDNLSGGETQNTGIKDEIMRLKTDELWQMLEVVGGAYHSKHPKDHTPLLQL